MVSKGQRYTTIISFSLIGVLLLYLCDDLTTALFVAFENASGSSLSINLNAPFGLACGICFLLHYVFMYTIYGLPMVLMVISLVCGAMVLIDIIRYRKLTVLMVLSVLSMVSVFYYGYTDHLYALFIALAIGLILFDQTYFLQRRYDQPYALAGLASDYMALFIGFKTNGKTTMDLGYIHVAQQSRLSYPKVKLAILNIVLILLSIISLGTLYGLTIHYRLKWSMSYRLIDGKEIVYNGKWYRWFIKGLKWVVFTLLTLGLYPLLGFIKMDQVNTMIECLHFSDANENDQSFSDMNMMDYLWIHTLGMIITIVSFGLLYPVYKTTSDHYLINHCVIDGYRLIDTASLKTNFIQWVWQYPLMIITIGCYRGIDHAIAIPWYNQCIHVDDDPLIYARDEMIQTME